jgi:SAM-dependent methyltransferase
MYAEFAAYYDLLMSDVDYRRRAEYVLALFTRFGHTPRCLLDVACGTGRFSEYFADAGIDVLGADISPEMLTFALNRLSGHANVRLICQSAAQLDLYRRVDSAVCLMDSLNHITGDGEFLESLKKIALFLDPGGLFVFDVNTPYKHREILGNNAFVLENGEVFCVWRNQYFDLGCRVDIKLDFFVKKGRIYERSGEYFSEAAYTPEQMEKLLAAAGFEVLGLFGDLSFNPPAQKSERVFYVCRKP